MAAAKEQVAARSGRASAVVAAEKSERRLDPSVEADSFGWRQRRLEDHIDAAGRTAYEWGLRSGGQAGMPVGFVSQATTSCGEAHFGSSYDADAFVLQQRRIEDDIDAARRAAYESQGKNARGKADTGGLLGKRIRRGLTHAHEAHEVEPSPLGRTDLDASFASTDTVPSEREEEADFLGKTGVRASSKQTEVLGADHLHEISREPTCNSIASRAAVVAASSRRSKAMSSLAETMREASEAHSLMQATMLARLRGVQKEEAGVAESAARDDDALRREICASRRLAVALRHRAEARSDEIEAQALAEVRPALAQAEASYEDMCATEATLEASFEARMVAAKSELAELVQRHRRGLEGLQALEAADAESCATRVRASEAVAAAAERRLVAAEKRIDEAMDAATASGAAVREEEAAALAAFRPWAAKVEAAAAQALHAARVRADEAHAAAAAWCEMAMYEERDLRQTEADLVSAAKQRQEAAEVTEENQVAAHEEALRALQRRSAAAREAAAETMAAAEAAAREEAGALAERAAEEARAAAAAEDRLVKETFSSELEATMLEATGEAAIAAAEEAAARAAEQVAARARFQRDTACEEETRQRAEQGAREAVVLCELEAAEEVEAISEEHCWEARRYQLEACEARRRLAADQRRLEDAEWREAHERREEAEELEHIHEFEKQRLEIASARVVAADHALGQAAPSLLQVQTPRVDPKPTPSRLRTERSIFNQTPREPLMRAAERPFGAEQPMFQRTPRGPLLEAADRPLGTEQPLFQRTPRGPLPEAADRPLGAEHHLFQRTPRGGGSF